MVCIVEGPKYTHKRHQNQLQKCRLNDSNDLPQTEEEPIDTIFDMFDLDPPQPTHEIRRSGRKRKFTDPLMTDQKEKKILTALLRSKRLGGGVLWEPYPYYFNGLFSPLLVQRFRCQKVRSLSVLYEQYETSFLFYVTLSFLSNNLLSNIRVCVFISDLFRGHNNCTIVCLSSFFSTITSLCINQLVIIYLSIYLSCPDWWGDLEYSVRVLCRTIRLLWKEVYWLRP